MKVLAFSSYYTPEIAASMYLTENIYEGIVEAGNTLEVYVPMPTRGISKEVRSEYKQKKSEQKYSGRLTVHRFSMYREGKSSILRAFRYLIINMAFIWKGLKTKADVIFVQSTPPTQGMMAGMLGAIKHIPVVYNLQDVFPDSLVNLGMTQEGSIIWRIGRKVEDYSYRHCKKIIVISEDFKRNILAKGVPEEKIVVIPNWADVGGVYPVERKDNLLIKKYGLDPHKYYITYSGNIGLSQNMDLLLDAAKELKEELPELTFILIGDGADRERVKNRTEEESITNVILLPFQPYADIAHVFSIGDAGLIISKAGVGNTSVPSKTWNIMAAGRPILASFDMDSELVKLIKTEQIGLCSDANDYDGLIRNIKELYNNRGLDLQLGKNGREYIRRYHNKIEYTRQYADTVHSAVYDEGVDIE